MAQTVADDTVLDRLVALIDPPNLREPQIAAPEGRGRYRFDIHLQGEGETGFLDV